MAALFSKPKTPPLPDIPKPIRMPTETDPDILAAAKRTRQAAMWRRGRMSTILTDQGTNSSSLGSAVGSSGKYLGA